MMFRAILLLSLLVLTLVSPSPARAQDPADQILFVGQLLSVSMRREDYSRPIRPNARGEIVVSNSCGTLQATFRVVRGEQRLPRRIVVTLGMGEWCTQHIPFEIDTWLVLLDRESRAFVEAYPLFEGEGERLYAFEEDDAERLARYSPRVRALLEAETLPAPVHYPFLFRGDRESFVDGERDLVLREGQVMITRGAPIDRIFPGITARTFFE